MRTRSTPCGPPRREAQAGFGGGGVSALHGLSLMPILGNPLSVAPPSRVSDARGLELVGWVNLLSGTGNRRRGQLGGLIGFGYQNAMHRKRIPEPEINNLALANDADNVFKQFNLTAPPGCFGMPEFLRGLA